MPLILDPAATPPDLRGRLADLRRRMRLVTIGRGVARLAALVLRVVTAVAVLHRRLHLPGPGGGPRLPHRPPPAPGRGVGAPAACPPVPRRGPPGPGPVRRPVRRPPLAAADRLRPRRPRLDRPRRAIRAALPARRR